MSFPSSKTLVNNLSAVYSKGQAADFEQGIAWYPEAQRIAREWSSHYRFSVDTVACVIAAISPQCEWTRNLIIADDILAQRPVSVGGALHVNLRKAEALRDSDYRSHGTYWTIELRMREQFKTGPKVLNFAHNLAGDMSRVTVDTHALQAAFDDPLTTTIVRPNRYPDFVNAYQVAASKHGRTPAEFQAIIWHVWRRLYPRVWKIQRRAQWSAMGEF